jgi:hypothetical protein
LIIKGILPIISITANNTRLAVINSLKSNTIHFFCKCNFILITGKRIICNFKKNCEMLSIENTLVSDELISENFVCNISKCKGECCVAGEAGAPLEAEETTYLQKNYVKIKPFLNAKGIKSIEEQGVFVKGADGDFETPLVKGEECAYTVFSDTGVASCGIENAYKQGVIDFQKPISCHLYPVRVQSYEKMVAVNYHSWSVCSDACSFGNALKIPVYQFVKAALIRKFGQAWFDALEAYAKNTSN